jgi:pyruvate,water dikinase
MEIRRLNEIGRGDAAAYGSKGANLGELTRLGIPIPPGLGVAATVYAKHAECCGLTEVLPALIHARDWTAVEKTALELLSARPLDPALSAALSAELTELDVDAVAVRSSAIAEDLAAASFAGQYRTVLKVRLGEELQRAIVSCWASLWCRSALEYRRQRSIDQNSGGMALVIQALVPADASGVLFTVDPVAQISDRILIEAVAGLGEALVSGRARDAVYRVDRASLNVIDREGRRALIPVRALLELCRLSLQVEEHFGYPQDIEFVLSEDKISLVQARPITTLGHAIAEQLEPLPEPTVSDRLMRPLVIERYVIAPRPLDNITYTRCVGAAVYGLRMAGAIVSDGDEAVFREEIWRQAYRFPPHRLTWRVLLHTWRLIRLLGTDWLPWWEAGPRPALRTATAPVRLSELDDEALFQRANRILAAWEEPLNKRMYIAGAFQTEIWLRRLVTLAVGRRKRDRVLAQLLSGLSQHPTVDANAVLWRLSRRARGNPEVQDAVRELAPERLDRTAEGRSFVDAFNAFLENYGHREGSCWYLSTPTWSRDPMQVWRLLRSTMEVDNPPRDPDQAHADYRAARERVERRLRFIPGLRPSFGWLLDAIRSLTVFREHSHFDLTRPLSALQGIATEWGRRLTERGILSEPDQVFYLTHQEVRAWLIGQAPDTKRVRDLMARRRATYQLANTRWQAERLGADVGSEKLQGIATSPGVARGRARLVRGEHQFERLQPGEVLVCPYTNPAWTPLFATAAAVVTETGGVASHAAIVAREYGIPAVMSVRGATSLIADGDDIIVDGNRGKVRPIRDS